MRWTRVAPGRKRCSRTEKSCGPDTLTLVSSRRRQTADDGGKRAGLTGESAKETVTPSRAGMPGDSGRNRGDYARVVFIFPREAAGAAGARHSPRPLWAEATGKTRADRAAGMRNCISTSLRGATRRSNPAYFAQRRKAGLLRGACHRARIRATRWLAMTAVAV
jgi:hypothetical protein